MTMSDSRIRFGLLDLWNNTRHWVRQGGFNAPAPKGVELRTVTLQLLVSGVDADDMWQAYRDLDAQIERARDVWLADDMSDAAPDAILDVRFGNSTTNARFDVVDGSLSTPVIGRAITKDARPHMACTLTLTCLPFARGAEVTGTVAGTITSGAASYADITDVRGDVPALTRFTFTDVSTSSKYLNRLRLGVFNSRRPIVASDLDLIADATAVSPGASGSESGTIGGARSRLAMSAAYQNVARFDRPDALTNGRYHAFMRVRDSSNLLTPPINLTAVPRTGVYRRQSTSGNSGTGTSAGGVWDFATLPGSTLVMYIASASTTHGTPSGWTSGANSGSSGGSTRSSIWVIPNASAQSGAAAVSALGASVAWDVRLEEWVGLVTSSIVDVTAIAASGGGSSSLTLGPTGTPSTSESLILAVGRSATLPPDSIGTLGTDALGTASLTASGLLRAASAQTHNLSWGSSVSGRSGAMVLLKAADVAMAALPAGLTSFRVIANGSGGTYSAASEPVTLRLATGQVADLDWDAGRGTVATYSAYMTDSTEGWVVAFNIPTITTTTAIVGSNEGSIGSSIPPGSGSAIPADVRVGLSLASGSTIWWQDGLKTQYANGAWELLYAGVLTLPPAPTPEGSAPLAWQVHVQGRHFYATGNLDVDALLLLPAWGDMAQIEVPTLDLAALREWVIESHRDGSVSARLRTTDTQADAGQLRNVQQAPVRLRPGFNRVQWLGDIGAGVSDVTDNKVTLAYAYTPLYRFVTGQP